MKYDEIECISNSRSEATPLRKVLRSMTFLREEKEWKEEKGVEWTLELFCLPILCSLLLMLLTQPSLPFIEYFVIYFLLYGDPES